jgi:PAS domain S-box-containing protein
MVWIGYAEEDEAKTVRPVAYAGFEEGYLKTLNITWADTENGRGPTGTAIRTGKPSACRNMLTDPQFAPWRKEAMKRGYASSMVFPLIGDGKTFGTITIYSKELDSFTEDEVGLLTGLANDLAYGITAIRLRAARAQAEEALRESEQRVRLKLDSILSPEGDIGNLDLADILDTPPIQSLMDSFYELVHIPMAIIDLKGKVLVGVGWQDICTQFHRVNPKTCKHCIESDTQLTQGVPPGESRLYKCKNNMWDIATPIIVGGEHVGNLFSGQFFFDDEPLDYGFFRSQAEKYGFNERDYIAALERVPRLSRESLNEGMAFFTKLAGILSRLSYSNIKLARSLTQRDALMGSLRRSEERLTRAQEISHLGSWELDLVNNRLSWSDEVYRIFGLQPQEFAATYEAFLEGVHPGDRAAVDAAYSDSLRDGRSSYEIEHRVVRRSTGEVRWVHEKCEHVEDETGRIIRSVGMVLDITDRKRMEGELQSLALFPDENPNPVMRVAADGSLLYFNVASKALLQYLGEDSEPTLPTELLMAVADANNVGSVREIDMDFEDRIFAFVLAPVINQGYVNLYGQDITDRVDFERQKEELYEREHHIADVLQKALVPDTVYDIPGCDIAVRYEAALKEAEVGGDFYDIFDLGDNKIGLLIGDVAGKGLAAAIQVAAARHSVRSYAYIDPRPERVMTLANNALCKDPQQGITMLTAFFAVLDLELGVMTYANGGHETPVLRRSDGGVEELAVEGRALGVMADYEYPDRGVILTPGDLVTMVTDGVTEARPNSNDLFGLERMKSFLSGKRARSAAELADGLLAAAKTHAGGDLRDDAAILVFGLRKEEKAR